MKQQFDIVKLYFKEPLALMSEKKDEFQTEVSFLSSDMLKATIISGLSLTASQADIDLLNEDLVVSSAFLFHNDHYFFPKPLFKLPVKISYDPKQQKQLKKIKYIEKSIFESVINARELLMDETLNLIHNGAIWVENKQEFPGVLYKSQAEERVSIGNTNMFGVSEKGSPFYVSRTYFAPGTGLYFIFKTSAKELLKQAFELLKDEGIGADRRVGNGRFTYEFDSIEINLPENANKNMLLSKYVPAQQAVQNGILNEASYQLSKRGGYVAGTTKEKFSHWTKLNIMMINEGAVFENKVNPEGKNVKLSNAKIEELLRHPVYRDGRPVYIPVLTDE